MIPMGKNRNAWWKPCHHFIYNTQAVWLFV